MLHFAVYLRQVVSGTFRIDKDPDGSRISEKVKLVHSQENKAQGHDIRLRLSIEVYSNLDEKHQEKRKVTCLPGQTRHKRTIQLIEIPLAGRHV